MLYQMLNGGFIHEHVAVDENRPIRGSWYRRPPCVRRKMLSCTFTPMHPTPSSMPESRVSSIRLWSISVSRPSSGLFRGIVSRSTLESPTLIPSNVSVDGFGTRLPALP